MVRVLDPYNNPVAGEVVNFVAMENSGQALTPKVATDDSGFAACRWVISRTPKTNTLMAYKLGLHNSPIQFTAIGVMNQFPEFINLPPRDVRIEYNRTFQFFVQAQDLDGDPLRFTLRMSPKAANAQFDSLYTRLFSWKPTVHQKGKYKIWLKVDDNRGGFDVDSLLVTVTGDSAPNFTSLYPENRLVPLTMPGSQLFTCAASDHDNDPIFFTWYVNGIAKATGPRFVLNSLDYGKGILKIWVEAWDGVKKTTSPEWTIIVESVELQSFTAKADPYRGVILQWITGDEKGNIGFDVFRSRSLNGNYEVINEKIIPSRMDHHYQFVDSTTRSGERYYYLLEDIGSDGRRNRHDAIEVNIALPEDFALLQNFPNPFNMETTIRFQLARSLPTKLVIYNTLGQQVRILMDKKLDAGYYEIKWDGRDDAKNLVASGIYYYKLLTSEYKSLKKLMVLR